MTASGSVVEGGGDDRLWQGSEGGGMIASGRVAGGTY